MSVSRIHIKKPDMVVSVCACNLGTGKAETGESLGPLASKHGLFDEIQANERF